MRQEATSQPEEESVQETGHDDALWGRDCAFKSTGHQGTQLLAGFFPETAALAATWGTFSPEHVLI